MTFFFSPCGVKLGKEVPLFFQITNQDTDDIVTENIGGLRETVSNTQLWVQQLNRL